MADTQNHTQVVTNLLSSIRLCVNALSSSDNPNIQSLVDSASTTENDGTLQEISQVESAILLLLEDHCFSVHNVRADATKNEYKLSPVKIPLNDNPDGTGGGVRLETIPYCFARPVSRKKWQAIYIHEGEENVWNDSHDVLNDFWREINNPQTALEDKKQLVQSILSTLYTQDCLDNPDVKELIIAIPENMSIGLFDTLKAECAEGLTRQIEHREHVFTLLTENSRYAKIPSKPSILFSLLRSVEGVPSEDQVFLFYDSDKRCTLGHLKQGSFDEHLIPKNKSGMDVDLQTIYAVGVVDEGKIVNPLIEQGYYNFHSMDEASYMAKTLAIIQEGTLETFKIAELIAKLSQLRDLRDQLQAKSDSQSSQIKRLKQLLSIPMLDIFSMQIQKQAR
jgi:hypothetical protein